MEKTAEELPLKELVRAEPLAPEIDPAWWEEEAWAEEAAPTKEESAKDTAPEQPQ